MLTASRVDGALVARDHIHHLRIGESGQGGAGLGQVLGRDVPLAAVGRHVDRGSPRPDHAPRLSLGGQRPGGGRIAQGAVPVPPA